MLKIRLVNSRFGSFQQSYLRLTQWTFVPNYLQYRPALLIKKIFKVFTLYTYKENSPAPGQPYFSSDWSFFYNIGWGSPKKHFCQNIFKSGKYFCTRRFFKSNFTPIRKTNCALCRPCFLTVQNKLITLDRWRFSQNNLQFGTELLEKKIFKVLAPFPLSEVTVTKVLHVMNLWTTL